MDTPRKSEFHRSDCLLKVWFDNTKEHYDSLFSEFSDLESARNNKYIIEYLGDQKKIFERYHSAHESCHCSFEAPLKSEIRSINTEELLYRLLALNMIKFFLYDHNICDFRINQRKFWEHVKNQPCFKEFPKSTLKSIFRDQVYGNLESFNFNKRARDRFRRVINPDFTKERSKLWGLAVDIKMVGMPEDIFWKDRFFSMYQLFDPSKTFAVNVSELKKEIKVFDDDKDILLLNNYEIAMDENDDAMDENDDVMDENFDAMEENDDAKRESVDLMQDNDNKMDED